MAYYGLARSQDEIDQAVRLASHVFSKTSAADASRYLITKKILWSDPSLAVERGLVVGCDNNGRVLGVIRIYLRTVMRGEYSLQMSIFSAVCVDPEFQGQGYSVPLMEAALKVASELGTDVVMLFARRAVDHYYTKFGFYGVSSYSKVVVKVDSFTAPTDLVFRFGALSDADLVTCNALYEDNYADVFGRTVRTPEYWIFIVNKFKKVAGLVTGVWLDDCLVGYFAHDDNTIKELAISREVSSLSVLAGISSMLDCGENLVLEISPQHSLFVLLSDTDYTYSARSCVYGGHMLRVLDFASIEQKFPLYASQSRNANSFCSSSSARKYIGLHKIVHILGIALPGQSCFSGEEMMPFDLSVMDQA